jgi:hypothetical protein
MGGKKENHGELKAIVDNGLDDMGFSGIMTTFIQAQA